MNRNSFRTSSVRGHALGLLAWALAFAIRYGLAHWFPPGFPYLTFFPAVVLVAYYAGFRPAVLTATLSGLTAWWFWIGPTGFDFGAATLVALGFYAFVVAVDIFFIVGMDRATRKLAAEVERNARLAASRDLVLREVQHRVSNNILVVSSLLKLEARATAEPAVKKILQEAAARTTMIAQLQRRLSDNDGKAANFAQVARETLNEAVAAAGRSEIEVEIVDDGTVLTADEATPVILILLESVNNALEHAFTIGGGCIIVRLENPGDERLLTVRDNGFGLPEGFTADKADSLGLRIVRGMAQQLGGKYKLEPQARGCIASLRYPRPADNLGAAP